MIAQGFCFYKGTRMNVFIDFDGTICPKGHVANDPFPDCIRVINKFKSLGYNITIFSCRANENVIGSVQLRDECVTEMLTYLQKHNIPYDDVCYGKPLWDVLIDDRCIGFHNNWENIEKRLS